MHQQDLELRARRPPQATATHKHGNTQKLDKLVDLQNERIIHRQVQCAVGRKQNRTTGRPSAREPGSHEPCLNCLLASMDRQAANYNTRHSAIAAFHPVLQAQFALRLANNPLVMPLDRHCNACACSTWTLSTADWGLPEHITS